jgi:hypothetical protein
MTGNDPTPRQYVESVLPSSYKVSEMLTGVIRCISIEGIGDEKDWDNIFTSIKNYFGDAFREVHHWTCYNHKDFTVYYSYDKLHNLTMDDEGKHILSKKSITN